MNHETLYLAVKLVDLYLGRTLVKRDKLQLVGTTALYIAAKYDVSFFINSKATTVYFCRSRYFTIDFLFALFQERCPPVIDDFCYICDDAYSQKDVIQMEEKMLHVLKFDIGVPLSYRFLRRYARVMKCNKQYIARFKIFCNSQLNYINSFTYSTF